MEDRIIEKETVIETLKRVVPYLTTRQLECLALYMFGLSQKDIAEILGISQQAVSDRLCEIWDKLGCAVV